MSSTGRKKPNLVAENRYGVRKKPTPKRKASPRRKAKPQRRRRGLLGWILAPFAWLARLLWAFVWRLTAVVLVLIAIAVGYTYTLIPPVDEVIDGRNRGSVTFMDRDGDVFAWRGDQFGGPIRATSVSPALHNAVIATEDKRFYRHIGVSPRGIASAVRINLREGRGPLSGHGGSTITQQTAKLMCLGVPYDPEKWSTEAAYEADCRRTTKVRKVKEAIYAMAMEAKYSKSDILTIYLNRAYLGGGARGFEAASQLYFGVSAAEVSVPQAAMLAGLLKAPSALAPTNNLERAQNRASVVLSLMEDQGYITATQFAAARANPAQLSETARARAGGYFVDWAMDTAPSFLTTDTTEDVVMRTTFDKEMQRDAEAALQQVFETKVSQGSKAQAAIVVMSPDGAVRAMVGGRDNKVAGAFNRATQAKRQTGSAFKPFVYGAAMDMGFQYDSVVDDAPVTISVPGSPDWSPQNYSRDFKGPMTLTDALKTSVNTVAVKVSEEIGRERVRNIAESFGIRDDLAEGPALALGVSESSLLEMTGAYAGLLNGGRAVTPYGMTQVRLKGDTVPLFEMSDGRGERVISPKAAAQLVYMMHRVVVDGTGRRAFIDGREAAAKTGTSQSARDAWFIGFTAQYVVGVWMGYDDNTPLRGTTGGGLPAEIWKETVLRISQGLPVEPLPMIRPEKEPTVDDRSLSELTPGSGQRQPTRTEGSTEDVILNVLQRLFGGD